MNSIVPSSGLSAPVTSFTKVNFPLPFSPTNACTSPGCKSKDTPFRACTASKDFRRWVKVTKGSGMRPQFTVGAPGCKVWFVPHASNFVLFGLALMVERQLLCAQISGEDWPRFLGARADNTSSETGLLDKWPTNGPPLLWDKDIGSGYSAPSVFGGQLVLHHRIQDQEIVQAFDATTGKPIWRYGYRSRFEDPFGYNNGPRCTPV